MYNKSMILPFEQSKVDERGYIKSIINQPSTNTSIIMCNPGSVRANHYHKTDWHYCYVINGKINYYHRKFNSEEEPEHLVVENGSMVFTPPLIEHCMKFPEDTLFLTLSRNPRDHETYEADVVRTNLIDASDSISWTPNK